MIINSASNGQQNSECLMVGISSRALFDLDESNAIFEKEGIERYAQYQLDHEDDILKPGAAFPFVKKLLHLNKQQNLVQVILLSRNSADTGLRVFNSIQHHELNIVRAVFTNGETPHPYTDAFGIHLFLSTNSQDVTDALAANRAAATILSSGISDHHSDELRIAFDGDAVLFSDKSERIYQEKGLKAFADNEKNLAKEPLDSGPFKGFLTVLHNLQNKLDNCPIRTALITARSAPSHERVIRTLRDWNIRIDHSLFLGGLDKGEFLKAFGADIYFDDQTKHCQSTCHHVATGHVPHGVVNERE